MNSEKLIKSILKEAQSQGTWTLIPSEYPEKNETDEAKDHVDKNLRVPHWDQVEMFLDKSNEDEDDEDFFDYNPNMPDPTPRTLNKDFGKFQNL